MNESQRNTMYRCALGTAVDDNSNSERLMVEQRGRVNCESDWGQQVYALSVPLGMKLCGVKWVRTPVVWQSFGATRRCRKLSMLCVTCLLAMCALNP